MAKISLLLLASSFLASSCFASPTILVPSDPSSRYSIPVTAAKQLRRYLHVLSHGEDAPGNIVSVTSINEVNNFAKSTHFNNNNKLFVLTNSNAQANTFLASSLFGSSTVPDQCLPTGEHGYAICTDPVDASWVSIVGADDVATLHGVHAVLQQYGMFFGLEGPKIPAPNRAKQLLATKLQPGFAMQQTPVFSLRGLQPFHDFDSGPDWWTEDEQKRVLESIAGMKGNFLGYHTYPIDVGGRGTGTNEPATWIGLTTSVLPDGTVDYAYPTSWANTLRAEWGMTAINTSSYIAGADSIYEFDCFGHPVQSGNSAKCPWPIDMNNSVQIMNDVGAMWQTVFDYAHRLGVKTCLGTETPISVPTPPDDVLIALNVYFSDSRDDHFATTTSCDECEDLYALVGVSGYIYSGQQPGTIGLSTYYNPTVGDNMLVPDGTTPPSGYSFVRVEGYAYPANASGQAGTTPLHQYIQVTPKEDHWAAAGAGMMNNASAAGYKDGGVIAQVWTMGTNLTSQDWYEGTFTRLDLLLGDLLDYYWIWTPEGWEWSQVNITNPLIADVVSDVAALQAAHDAVGAKFGLATCGWVVGPLGYRSYFDTVLPPGWALGSIDMQVGNTPVDGNYSLIKNHEKWVAIWAEDDPGLTAPELWVNRSIEHCQEAESYNISALLSLHWRTRAVSPQMGSAHGYSWNSSMQASDYWVDWATAQFGPSIGAQAGAILSSIDSDKLPRPVNWVTGPGTMTANNGQCGWATTYAWVDAFTALRPSLMADVATGFADAGNVESFEYWAQSFTYMRGIARMECDWAAYGDTITAITKITDPTQRQAAARAAGYAARLSLVTNVTQMLWDHLSRISSLGDLGTYTNALSQSLYNAVGAGPTSQLEALAQETLPANLMPALSYNPAYAPLLRVLVPRSMLASEEPFRVECFILTTPTQAPTSVTLYTAPMGSSSYSPVTMSQVPGDGHTRQVYKASLNGFLTDFQWYIQAELPANASVYVNIYGDEFLPAGTHLKGERGQDGVTLVFPPTAPSTPQTVIII